MKDRYKYGQAKQPEVGLQKYSFQIIKLFILETCDDIMMHLIIVVVVVVVVVVVHSMQCICACVIVCYNMPHFLQELKTLQKFTFAFILYVLYIVGTIWPDINKLLQPTYTH